MDKKRKKIYYIAFLILVLLLTSGCVIKSKKKAPTKSGIFKSQDKGDEWRHKNLLIITGGVTPFENINVGRIYLDPNDNNALYITTNNRGIFYTYNGGEHWQQPAQLSSGEILSLSIDPKDKCIIYVSMDKKILKSVDCNRSYQEIYIDPRNIQITTLQNDPVNSFILYAGTSQGNIIRSLDGGRSWNTLYSFNSKIKKILIERNNAKTIYVVLNKGMAKSYDGGSSWELLKDGLKPYSGANDVIDLIFNPSKSDSLLLLSKYGILKSVDAGQTWEAYNLITPPLSTKIYAFAVNPQNDKEIYYGTATTFYKTEDGGKNWIVKRLPTAARINALLIDPINPRLLYMGTFIDQKNK